MKNRINAMMRRLRAEKINTWFDLGLFLDRIRENRPNPPIETTGTFESFKKRLQRGGVAFITFYYAVDGVTMEAKKYAASFQKIFPKIPVHFVAGSVHPEAQLPPSSHVKVIPELQGFDSWKLYDDFFFTKFKRGSATYNRLIKDFWQETLLIAEKLSAYIAENNIQILYVINTHSNPGNVSLALGLVLLSEYLKIPVINNCHDFYWESGNRKIDIVSKRLKPGPRDLFFRNADVGEFFSIIQMLYPWESRAWISVNLNTTQSRRLIEKIGHNPANVREIGTAVAMEHLLTGTERRKRQTLVQISKIFSGKNSHLRSQSVDQYLAQVGAAAPQVRPALIGLQETARVNLLRTILFLQPTRIIERKRIDLNVDLVKKLLNYRTFSDYFRTNNHFTLTVLVTGPVAMGHNETLIKILKRFKKLRQEIDPYFHDKVFFGFLLSEFDKPRFKKRFPEPISIFDLYSCASLTLLPSETEGRGLPIIESAAAGVPIVTRRYRPFEAYAQVIGEHLNPNDRLKTLEFHNDYISEKIIHQITDRLIHPFRFAREIELNRGVAERRFSPETLKKDIWNIMHALYKQQHPDYYPKHLSEQIIRRYQKKSANIQPSVRRLMATNNRQYLAGYGKLAYMLYLKSLIDPSYFRVEEQELRGLIMDYAQGTVQRYSRFYLLSYSKIHRFYNCIDHFFTHHEGSFGVRVDHSFAYRHRNKFFYPYRELTFQELTGAVNLAFDKIVKPHHLRIVEPKKSTTYIPPLHQALLHLTDSYHLSIDQTEQLGKRLGMNVPYAYFPGRNIADELEVFVTRSLRGRLKLQPEDTMTMARIQKAVRRGVEPVYIIIQNKHAWHSYSARALKEYISHPENIELKMLVDGGLCRIVPSKQIAIGIHFQQLGSKVLQILEDIRRKNGFLIASGEDAAMTSDIIGLDVFHIGSAQRVLTAKIMGIPQGSGFVEWVPPGLRSTLAYPTPIQTARQFAEMLRSPLFRRGVQKFGKRNLLGLLREDADNNGSPLEVSLKNIVIEKKKKKRSLRSWYLTGVYTDGMPYYGVMARLKRIDPSRVWRFRVLYTSDKPKTAQKFFEEYNAQHKDSAPARIAWNGGYLLNAELIGKLGLSHTYIGSPLGLVISDGAVVAPPLFNKPAILFYQDGRIRIKRVNCRKGLVLIDPHDSGHRIKLTADNYNRKNPNDSLCYYDLMYDKGEIPGDGRVVCRLSGRVVKEVIRTKKGQSVPHIPTGLTLSFPKKKFPGWMQKDTTLKIVMREFSGVREAIEAGPQIIRSGKIDIDMEREGWKRDSSIATQAARTDYEDMRGPKIAVGIDRDMDLYVAVINGRIRESVGARHKDMAQILKKRGIIHAMGFDPGGSATLLVDGKTLNISPFNHDYEKDAYSLPPEPRPISNLVIGWEEVKK